MMGKSIPLNNGQRKEQIFVVTGCSWYLDEMEWMHVSCHSNRVIDILRKGRSITQFSVGYCTILFPLNFKHFSQYLIW